MKKDCDNIEIGAINRGAFTIKQGYNTILVDTKSLPSLIDALQHLQSTEHSITIRQSDLPD